jgi:hypothetical protein
MADKMINSSSKTPAGSVLTDTLKDYDQYDMNVMNDPLNEYEKERNKKGATHNKG